MLKRFGLILLLNLVTGFIPLNNKGNITALEKIARNSGKASGVNLKLKQEKDFISSTHSWTEEPCFADGKRFCPKWSFCGTDKTCLCPTNQNVLRCDEISNGSYALSFLDCTCVTYNQNEHVIEFGFCVYACGWKASKYDIAYHEMPQDILDWNNFTCGHFKRSDTLCGRCDGTRNLYPRAYSFDISCTECQHSQMNWLMYIISAFLPLTMFCFVILLFKINVYSSQLQGFILFSQFISIPALSRVLININVLENKPLLSHFVKFLSALYGIWNLDFFRGYNSGYCLKFGTLGVSSLDFAIALYPLLLVALTYGLVTLYDKNFKPLVILWRPFGMFFGTFIQDWKVKTSLIDSFSSFVFLSNMKFLSVAFDLLVPVKVFQFTNPRHVHYEWRLYYDASIPYFKGIHIAYGSTAVVVFFSFVFLPVSLLWLYPFRISQKTLGLLPNRGQIFISTFVESFQGSYKDGIEPGTKDCRWFSAVILVARFLLLGGYAMSPTALYFSLSAIVFTIISILVIAVDPFKPQLKNTALALATSMIIAAMFHTCCAWLGTLEDENVQVSEGVVYLLAVITGTLPLFHASALILIEMAKQRKLFKMYCIQIVIACHKNIIS